MANSNELLPEERDEQHRQLIGDLRLFYRSDDQKAHHLARIQQRLNNNDASMHTLPHNVIHRQQRNGDVKAARALIFEEKPWQRRLSMMVAVVVVALLVSSLLLVLNRAHHSGVGTSAISTGGLNTLRSIHMIDAMTGWALSEQAILRTTDGGIHWKNVTPTNTILTQSSSADFHTASIASIATPETNAASTQVLHTSDGGQTWQQAIIQIPYPRQISFVDPQHGWLLGSVRPSGGAAESISVFRTTDGGKTWINVATALFADATPPGRLPYGGQKSGIRFLNASTGWVTGTVTLSNLAWLYVTHDSGSTWQQQSLPMPTGIKSAQLSILTPSFFSAVDGILPVIFYDATTDSEIATDIYVTHNAGQSWQSTAPIFTTLSIQSFADMQHWWVSDGTTLYSTSDGGNHWTKLSPGSVFKNITRLDFVSATVGWAISSPTPTSSSLLKTSDGGETWASI